MKKIKNLNVTVTYTVTLIDVEVPDDVYNQMYENEEIEGDDFKNSEAAEWLAKNINEDDAMDWSYIIDDFE